MTQTTQKHLPIRDFVSELRKFPESAFNETRDILHFLTATQVDPDTLAPYVCWDRQHYTRNLIDKTPLYELISICWEVGQASSVHNHRDQNCWMAVPIGKLRVQNFRVEQRDSAHGKCKLVPTEHYDMDATHPGVVRPEEPVHQVLNLPEFEARATTLHIYSHPYSSCEIYSLDKGVYSDVPLHYSSEYGKLSPEEKLL